MQTAPTLEQEPPQDPAGPEDPSPRRRIVSLPPRANDPPNRPGPVKAYPAQKVYVVMPTGAAKHMDRVHSCFASHEAATRLVGRLGDRYTIVCLAVSRVGNQQDDDTG